jgi:hypothetical protein
MLSGVIWISIMILWLIVMSVVCNKLKEDRVINGYLIGGGILFPATYLGRSMLMVLKSWDGFLT